MTHTPGRVNPRARNNIQKAEKGEKWTGEDPTKEEVEAAITKMGVGKAGGDDEVLAEHLKYGGAACQEEVVRIVQTMWRRAAHAEETREADGWPGEWTLAIQVPLWKSKGDRNDKNTWRGVTLLSVGAKVLARVVADRVQKWMTPWRREDQMGFMSGRGTDDAHQVSRRIAEETAKGKNGSGNVVISMYDIEKAYPRVCRNALWDLMRRWGCDDRLVAVCRALHDHTRVVVRVHGGVSSEYMPERGLREGCPTSPPLFTAYHTAVMNDYEIRRRQAAELSGHTPGIKWTVQIDGKLSHIRRQKGTCIGTGHAKKVGSDTISKQTEVVIGSMCFADDTATVAEPGEEEQAERILVETTQDWEEKLHPGKTEKIWVIPEGRQETDVRRKGETETAKHVGAWLHENGKPNRDTLERVMRGKKAYARITRAWMMGARGSRSSVKERLARTTRINVMKAGVVPTMTAFCKTRAWSAYALAQVGLVERRALRAAFGITMKEVREHKIRHDRLYKAACWLPIDKVIKRETLRWMGHVARMKKDRLPKIALFGWRKGVDPKVGTWYGQERWMKNVLKEAQIPEMDWFRAAQSRGPSGKWQWLIDRAFPRDKATKSHKIKLNRFKVGYDCTERLPIPEKKRRIGRWPYKLDMQERECPVCGEISETGSALEKHYSDQHAVFDPEITTHQEVKCKYCGEHVRAATKLGEHREKYCKAWKRREKREGEGGDGWMPVSTPSAGDIPERWYVYTDGSGPATSQTWREQTPGDGAGWGVGVFRGDQAGVTHEEGAEEPAYKLSGPVITEKTNHLFVGAEEATNNTGELTAMIEGMIWLQTEMPDGGGVPITVRYDSEYAAGMTRGNLVPTTNVKLVEKAREVRKKLEEKRQISWSWVKGHSGENGNWWADKLADEGKQGSIGEHNERWAAPPTPVAEWEKDWMHEVCRKCGEDFQLDGRRSAAHETKCTGKGVQGMGFPGYMKCRKCGFLTGSGVEDTIKLMRQNRRYHEDECLGTDEANKTCRGCGMRVDDDAENPLMSRRMHEQKCAHFRNRAQSAEEAFWTCICGYKCGKANWQRNKEKHEAKCRGDSLLNRTCVCGFVQDESLPFVHWAHLKICKKAKAR